jgi:hypothetical protein
MSAPSAGLSTGFAGGTFGQLRPDLVYPLHSQIPQQIRKDLVARRRFRRAWFRPQGSDPHEPHRPLHTLTIDVVPLGPQHRRHPSRAEERPAREQLVDPAQQHQIVVVRRARQAIDAGASDPEHRTLPPHRKLRVMTVELRSAVRCAHRPNLAPKKSFSTVS